MRAMVYTLILWLFTCIISWISAANITGCTSDFRCTCQRLSEMNQYAVDCSNLRLTESPVFSNGVISVDLSHNMITELKGRQFPATLLRLDLSHNPLHVIRTTSFLGLVRLQWLNLAFTLHEMDNSTLRTGIFRNLRNLKYLNIKNSRRSGKHYPAEALSDLTSLETLLMNGKQFGLQKQFSTLRNLRNLDLSGDGGNCSIGTLHMKYFQYTRNISVLNLAKCSISSLERDVFSKLTYLGDLDLSYNEELSFGIMQNLTRDLKTTNIRVLRLNKIHCTFGVGTEILISDIKHLQNTSLREIYLDNNRIMLVQRGVLMYLPKTLEHISVADNKLTMGWYVLETANLVSLKSVNLTLQQDSHDPFQIYTPCNDVYNRRQITQRLNDHHDNSWNRRVFDTSVWVPDFKIHIPFPVPQHAETGYFNGSYLRYAIKHFHFGNNRAKHVYLQENVLHEWTGPVVNVGSLETLDLSNNFCSNLSTYFFDNFFSLRDLKINNNMLGFSLEQDVAGKTFKNLRNLTKLDMSSNKIQNLTRNIFKNLSSLKTLMLKNNIIRKFPVSFEHMKNLERLDLSNNQIAELEPSVTAHIDVIIRNNQRKTPFILDLSNNPLRCDCDNLPFVHWLVWANVTVKFSPGDTCMAPESKGGAVRMTSLKDHLIQLEGKCRSYIELIIFLVGLIVTAWTVVICAILYRYRWKIRYLFYMTKNHYFGYRHIRENYDQIFEYDAFISYADEDRPFAFHEILRNLEDKCGFKLCFHSRDFTPGVDIAENITKAIHNSRKTVCIVTSNFLDSYWCMYELNIARMESIYSRDGQEVLFLVLYEDADASQFPLSIMDLIGNKSYIEYPDDPCGNTVFWEKMKETIGDGDKKFF